MADKPLDGSARMTREEWLALPYLVRWWRVKTCHHPWVLSALIGSVRDTARDTDGYRYLVHVRECGSCRQHFIDAGLEGPSRSTTNA